MEKYREPQYRRFYDASSAIGENNLKLLQSIDLDYDALEQGDLIKDKLLDRAFSLNSVEIIEWLYSKGAKPLGQIEDTFYETLLENRLICAEWIRTHYRFNFPERFFEECFFQIGTDTVKYITLHFPDVVERCGVKKVLQEKIARFQELLDVLTEPPPSIDS